MAVRASVAGGACADCLRRSWLLAELGAVLDCNCRADARLLELLELDDRALIAALGGRRRAALEQRHATYRRPPAGPSGSGSTRAPLGAADVASVCRHDTRYPPGALAARGLGALHVLGGLERLQALAAEPVVAFVGRASASDYGVAVAASLARGLAAAGVVVASGLAGGIGPAALAGALELGAPTLGVIAGGLDTGAPARQRVLRERLTRAGCALAELPCGSPRRRSAVLGGERLLAALADVALVVESEQSPNALAGARVARSLGRAVAAVPGRVGSRGARGPHALLREDARLVTCASDVLDLLCDADRRDVVLRERHRPNRYDGLDPALRHVLERVGAGADTPGRLLDRGHDAGELLRALGELELMGLLARGDGGRYVQRDPLAESELRYGVSGQMES
ncbi:MAG TPA: DNA-processing protein DprA [Solirubrobacteraceae bacterium]|nr:DNA-processing protein DprA [Solirubrobacteraceae bacterium]